MRDVEIPNWLKGLPLAPEFHPTDTEFADPIAYISKIEKEASVFGICKVIPPLPKPSKTYVFSNLNKSLSKCPELGLDVNLSGVSSLSKMGSEDKGNDGEFRAVFTTRHQELGQSEKRKKGTVQSQSLAVHKQVWQTGEIYTLEQFESKSKTFARSHLRMVKDVSPLVIEALFWKAASEKPIYVEYANDVPGSGFGEPEGPFRRFHRRRRRRRRTFYRNSQGGSDSKKDQEPMSNKDKNNRASTECDPSSSEISKASSYSPDMLSNQTSQFSRQKSSNAGNEMEGTSGWKLSNSPWNLQVIARSPGSLTRFMPDDIPGVTSPMVYIGMLFSWFAWHVEDHELHSLNFLHSGSPKTWYAVPGDYAFTFEEVIRAQAYGGNIDRLAALTLLGEKTTLLSPEVVVGSGIPCCRLVQNPGEFVVTFPRAYHVGFSHGFNCGEAANFGTPKWLTVAKEAAVRRAAMNYLPMLSHQQLLYLLTMSFISRVPRSLLPGVRSSRLRDRQKEEREILVKKAFIEDILNENKMLTILLRKNSSFHAVLWDLESLPSSMKESDLCCSSIAAIATTPIENVYPENDNNQDLFSQMSLYMETVNDSYVDDDDLSYGFQIDSGTLPCVACGVLGFPFMSVVQPSEKLKMDLLPADHHMVQDVGVLNPVESHSPADLNGMVEGSISDGLDNQDKTLEGEMSSAGKWQTKTPKSRREFNLTKDSAQSYIDANSFSSDAADKMKPNENNLVHHPNGSSSSDASGQSMSSLAEDQSLMPDFSPPPKDHHDSSNVKFEDAGNTSSGYLRPRIFCLEHAIQIEELLHSKGGADVLVICHSGEDRLIICVKWVHNMETLDWTFPDQESRMHIKNDTQAVINSRSLDFQKIKAHAAAIAEEIGSPFNYNEISLDDASQEDLNLINLAIDDEEQDECGEDWTSKLNINLRHCVKLRKKFPSEKGQHALTLEGLLSDTAPSSSTLSLKWQSRKSRSKRNVNQPDHSKPSESIQTEKDEVLGAKPGGHMARKEERIIQYSRRSFKSNPRGSAGASKASGGPRKLLPKELSAAGCADPEKNSSNTTEINFSKTKNTGSSSSGLGVLTSIGKSELQYETTRDLGVNTVLSQTADSLVAATPVFENVNAQIGNDTLKEMVMKDKACVSTWNDSQMQPELKVAEESSENNERFAGSLAVSVESSENIEIERENQIAEEISMTNETRDMVNADDLVGICNIQADGAVFLKEGSDPAKPEGSRADDPAVGSFDEPMEKTELEKFCTNREVYDCVNLDNRVQQEIQITNGSNENKPVSSDVNLINNSTLISLEESLEVPRETGAAEDMHSGGETCSLPGRRELDSTNSSVQVRSTSRNGSKRKREVELQTEDRFGLDGFIKSPCEGLRPRGGKDAARAIDRKRTIEEPAMKKMRNPSNGLVHHKDKKENRKGTHRCDLESCRMSFQTKAELLLHKRNRCPHEGCGKKFSSHKYATLHLRVHVDDRPLKCPWKGCTMSFKWAWARTEHLRVHTGERPYQCKVEGCGLTFRFVSDFSRHRRKTGHYVNLPT